MSRTDMATSNNKGFTSAITHQSESTSSPSHLNYNRVNVKNVKEAVTTLGKMLDSDGFEVDDKIDSYDVENMTLEEKILCGFYKANVSEEDEED